MRIVTDDYGESTTCYPTKAEFDNMLFKAPKNKLDDLNYAIREGRRIQAIKTMRDIVYVSIGYTSGLKVTKDYIDNITMKANADNGSALTAYMAEFNGNTIGNIVLTLEGNLVKAEVVGTDISETGTSVVTAIGNLSETIRCIPEYWNYFNEKQSEVGNRYIYVEEDDIPI